MVLLTRVPATSTAAKHSKIESLLDFWHVNMPTAHPRENARWIQNTTAVQTHNQYGNSCFSGNDASACFPGIFGASGSSIIIIRAVPTRCTIPLLKKRPVNIFPGSCCALCYGRSKIVSLIRVVDMLDPPWTRI